MLTPSQNPAIANGRRRKRTGVLIVALIAICILAAFYRFYRITTLPPGESYDPAWYGVDALDILSGQWPIFLPTNFGREVMFSYLTAIMVRLFGVGPLPIHFAAAVVGLITVPAIYLVAKELLSGEDKALATAVPMLSALLLAISYWHLVWSRFGVRAVLVPLFTCLVFYFVWRAFRTQAWRDYLLAGLTLGLSVYTYQAARIIPLLVVTAFALQALRDRRLERRMVLGLLLLVGTSLVVFAPLAFYFLTHPGSFTLRINQTWAVAPSMGAFESLQVMWNRFMEYFLILLQQGEDKVLYYLVGRPILDIFVASFFLLGMVVALWRIRKPPFLFLILWLLVMMLPAILAEGRATKRALGALPAVVILTALGVVVLWIALNRWAGRRQDTLSKVTRMIGQVALGTAIVLSGYLTYRDYFQVWGHDPDLYTHFETRMVEIGQAVASRPPDERIYVSPVPVDHPSIVYNSNLRPDLRRYNGRACQVIPIQTNQTTSFVIVPGEANDPHSLQRLRGLYPGGEIVSAGTVRYGQPEFEVFQIPAGESANLPQQDDVSANWADKIQLWDHSLDRTDPQAGDSLQLSLTYRSLDEMEASYTAFVQLIGPINPATGSPVWAQIDSEPCQRYYPTTQWKPGEIIMEDINLTIPPDTIPGQYELVLGFYRWPELERLPLLNSTGTVQGDAYALESIEIIPADSGG